MYEWITITAYPWIKALHIIAVISWMAGMLYLPRLFVYHCEAEVGSKQSETFKVMEWRLLKAIINPAMIITWLAGLYLAWSGHWYTSGWFHAKLTLVLVLSGVHGFFSRLMKDFAADRNTRDQKFFRIINEVYCPDGFHRHPGDREAVLEPCFCRSAFSLLLAKRPTIFYIAEIPPHAGGCGCVPVSSLDPAAASGLKPHRRFPCLDLRTFHFSCPLFP